MLLTFRTGQEALSAASLDNSQILNQTIRVQLQTPNWKQQIEKELQLVKSNTAALFNTTTNSLLGEDFSIPTMSFDMEGKLHIFLCSDFGLFFATAFWICQ